MGASFDFDSGIKHQQFKKQGGKASFRNTVCKYGQNYYIIPKGNLSSYL